MDVQLNHTVVWCSDKQKSTRFLMDILGFRIPLS
ncbi:catechol 2,3-dioxygenase-like lactoylglutathione lyase family enzyme [Paraburkholderia sp. WSM4175]